MLYDITLAQLAELSRQQKPIVIDFYATWCGPCKMFAPTYERVAEKYADRAEFVKVNVDQVPELADHFDITAVPTVVALRDGEVVHNASGVMNEPSFVALLDSLAR